jgi:ribosomal-protein-alanine N-acetyltransferase
MKEKTLIRDYTSKDKEAVLHLLKLNTPQYFAPSEENDLIDYLSNHIEHYYVLEFEHKIVGCGGINVSPDLSTGIISWDIFNPAFQGKGFGSLLLKHRLNLLTQNKQIKSIVVRTSQLAFRFYEKNGFRLLEKTKDYWSKGFDIYRMEFIVP